MMRRMKRTMLRWAAIVAFTLAARLTGEGTALGQAAGGAGVRRPADYIMIPGEVNGGSSAVVYMIDTSNGLLGAMTYDDSNRALNTMPPIDLSRVFEVGGGPAPRGTQVAPGARGVGR